MRRLHRTLATLVTLNKFAARKKRNFLSAAPLDVWSQSKRGTCKLPTYPANKNQTEVCQLLQRPGTSPGPGPGRGPGPGPGPGFCPSVALAVTLSVGWPGLCPGVALAVLSFEAACFFSTFVFLRLPRAPPLLLPPPAVRRQGSSNHFKQ